MSFHESLKPEGALMDTLHCKEWRSTHENCSGCSSEKPCKEWVNRIADAEVTKLMAEGLLPESYDWYEETGQVEH